MQAHLLLFPPLLFIATIIAHLGAITFFPKLGLLDFPHRYGLTRKRIPYPTGIIAVALFLIAFLSLFTMTLQAAGLIAAVLLLAGVSFADDRRQLPFWLRLTAQIFAAMLIVAAGSRIYTITNPLGGIIKLDQWTIGVPVFGSLPVLSGLFTVVWLLLTINALNWFDGIPGQVSLISSVGFLLIGCLAYFRNGQPDTALLALLLCAIATGSAIFDFPPGKVLMGDTGSMFFGLTLGLLGIYEGGKVATAFLAIGIPLADAGFVIVRWLLRGRSPFKGDHDHLHHRLLARGLGKRSIVLLLAGISGSLGLTALFLDTAGKAMQVGMLLMIVAALTLLTAKHKSSKG